MANKKTIVSKSDDDFILDLKNPWLAAFELADSGAGQIYQKRTFKGVLFGVCVLGMFFCGVLLGEGRPVYCYYEVQESPNSIRRFRNYGYLSQVLVGLPSLPAVIQSKRFEPQNLAKGLTGPIDEAFEGELVQRNNEPPRLITGAINLKEVSAHGGRKIEGVFVGKLLPAGDPLELKLIESTQSSTPGPVGPEVSADPKRYVFLEVAKSSEGPDFSGRQLVGYIPRSFFNWYQVPLQDHQLQNMNGNLGKRWELAMVLTWLAGLLNILVIWDAFEGPAHDFLPEAPKDKGRPPEPKPAQNVNSKEPQEQVET